MASRFPIKFGIQTPPEQASWPEQVRMWRFCEDLGYDTMWSSDHFIPGTGANAPID
ncbi:MAG: hypothetical protein HY261_03900, partial [Chloroflexi bacterium]|nr:hypothetical protein [Chloroflexota bacterium]